MARLLNYELDRIMLGRVRRPKWKIEVFDLRSATSDTIGSIVRGLTLETITGPRVFTSDTILWKLKEQASDFAKTGVAVPSLELQIVDPTGAFDPVTNGAGDGRWLRKGNVVRLYEGDAAVDEDLWPNTFTGKLRGRPGVDLNRTGGGRGFITSRALGREKDFINVPNTSADYGVGVTLKTMALNIAGADMGLDSDEIVWSNWGTQVNGHLSLQFVDLPPLVAIANLMMVDGLMPRFNGEGKLSESLGLITQAADRLYNNLRLFTSIQRPFSDVDPVNSVTVIGLDTDTTEISQPAADLSEIHITTGYFTQDERFDAFFTEDHRGMAKNASVNVIKSADSGLSFLGGGESFTPLPAKIGPHFVGFEIRVSTGFVAALLITLTVSYVAASFIPDYSLPFGGPTIPTGRIIQAIILVGIMMIMAKIGKAHYALRGEVVENVYLQLTAEGELPGLTLETRVPITVNNQAIQTQDDANDVARNLLFRQQALGALRQVEMLPDLRLEPDDVFEIPGQRLFQIQSAERTGKRSRAGQFAETAKLSCSELTAIGVE